jgi:mRNA interferase MazF
MVISRGEIWWAHLPDPAGTDRDWRRPVAIVSSDAFNRSSIPTVLAVTLSTDLKLAAAPGNFLLTRAQSGLPKDSVVNVSQLVTLDRSCLRDRAGGIPDDMLERLNRGLRLVLDRPN